MTDEAYSKWRREQLEAERKADAEALAKYQRDCLASWAKRDAAGAK